MSPDWPGFCIYRLWFLNVGFKVSLCFDQAGESSKFTLTADPPAAHTLPILCSPAVLLFQESELKCLELSGMEEHVNHSPSSHVTVLVFGGWSFRYLVLSHGGGVTWSLHRINCLLSRQPKGVAGQWREDEYVQLMGPAWQWTCRSALHG